MLFMLKVLSAPLVFLVLFSMFINAALSNDLDLSIVESVANVNNEEIIDDVEGFGEFILDDYFLNGNYTIIEISSEESQLLQSDYLKDSEGTIVGGTLVIPGNFSSSQQEIIKSNFINNNVPTETVSNQWNSNVNVNSGVVSAGVGFNVNQSRSVGGS